MSDHFRFQAIMNQSAIATQVYRVDGTCVSVNRAWVNLFDATIEQLQGYNVLEDPQVKAIGIYDHIIRAISGEESQVPEHFYDPAASGKKGRGRWLIATCSPVRDDQGKVFEIVVLFSDITELKLAQEELTRSRDQMKSIFDHVPEGIVLQDNQFRVLYANPSALSIVGLKPTDQWSMMKITEEFTLYQLDGASYPIDDLPSRRIFKGERNPPEVSIRFKRKDNGEERIIQMSGRAIYDEKERPYQIVNVFRDITEKLKIETKLREALEARELFFSVASHEFRTPLTALKLNAQLVNLSWPNIPSDVLTKMNRQVNKLSKLVDDMLDISRLSRGRLELQKKEVNLSHLTREVITGMMDQLKLASIPLTLKINENITGHWDPDRLEQVLENLITNAIRYARNSPLYVSLTSQENFAVLEVCDQGPGIPVEDHEKIFKSFEQSRSFGERSGMGLGLYIVKEIVSLHGGKISVSNLNTGGARFVIELPFLHGG